MKTFNWLVAKYHHVDGVFDPVDNFSKKLQINGTMKEYLYFHGDANAVLELHQKRVSFIAKLVFHCPYNFSITTCLSSDGLNFV